MKLGRQELDADGSAREVRRQATKVEAAQLNCEPGLGTKITGRADDQLMRAVNGGQRSSNRPERGGRVMCVACASPGTISYGVGKG